MKNVIFLINTFKIINVRYKSLKLTAVKLKYLSIYFGIFKIVFLITLLKYVQKKYHQPLILKLNYFKGSYLFRIF